MFPELISDAFVMNCGCQSCRGRCSDCARLLDRKTFLLSFVRPPRSVSFSQVLSSAMFHTLTLFALHSRALSSRINLKTCHLILHG